MLLLTEYNEYADEGEKYIPILVNPNMITKIYDADVIGTEANTAVSLGARDNVYVIESLAEIHHQIAFPMAATRIQEILKGEANDK